MRDVQRFRLSAAARAFVFLALGAPILWAQHVTALWALAAVGLIWVLAQAVGSLRPHLSSPTALVEAAAVGSLCALMLDSSVGFLGVLAVQPFTAGIYRGTRGVFLSLSAELVALVLVAVLVGDPALTPDQSFSIFTWIVTGLGLGFIASFIHATLSREPDPLEPYLYAQSLIRELIDLSGGLSSGLDPQTLGGSILSTIRDELPTTALAMYVPRDDTVAPLVTKLVGGSQEDLTHCEELAVRTWSQGVTVVDDRCFAFRLVTDAGTVAVVAGILSERLEPAKISLEHRIRTLRETLRTSAVHLDTALLFLAFRDAATAEERRRLAREMHDGVAQDIASLGYLVDALAARPGTPEQAQRIEALRERISSIVAEVRQSVMSLRTSVGSSESLGAAISTIARNLSEVSGVPIRVWLDEHTARLRPDVEAELFRITQEAMNNALKHAQASRVDVHCQVHAPRALITVTDDGRGLQDPQVDSQGLKIMRERADLVKADLTVEDLPSRGLRVTVRLPATDPHDPASNETTHDASRSVTA